MMRRISLSVSRMPSAAMRPMLAMVFSTFSFTRPSPAPKVLPSSDICMGKDGRIHRSGDLGGAAALGAVAHDAGGVGQRVGDGAADGVVVAAVQVGDARAAAAGRAHRAAEGAQPADAPLLQQGGQVAQHQRPVQGFLGGSQILAYTMMGTEQVMP